MVDLQEAWRLIGGSARGFVGPPRVSALGRPALGPPHLQVSCDRPVFRAIVGDAQERHSACCSLCSPRT
eukprot:11647729-Alexandrium_andersonii.AAC.1